MVNGDDDNHLMMVVAACDDDKVVVLVVRRTVMVLVTFSLIIFSNGVKLILMMFLQLSLYAMMTWKVMLNCSVPHQK